MISIDNLLCSIDDDDDAEYTRLLEIISVDSMRRGIGDAKLSTGRREWNMDPTKEMTD